MSFGRHRICSMAKIADKEGKRYYPLIEGMLYACCAMPRPATGKSRYKMRIGIIPKYFKIGDVRRNHAVYKLRPKVLVDHWETKSS